MEETYNINAIITNNQPWREHDAIITAYSADYGKLELLARGVKKGKSKLAGHLEPASLVNLMVIRGRYFDYVGSAINENSFANLKNCFEKIFTVGQALRFFNKLIKVGESDERIFFLLKKFLEILNKNNLPPGKIKILLYFFIFKILAELGYAPQLFKCVGCSSVILANNKTKFAFKKKGLVCPECQTKKDSSLLTMSDNCIKILRIIIKDNLEKIIDIKINENLKKEICWFIINYQKSI